LEINKNSSKKLFMIFLITGFVIFYSGFILAQLVDWPGMGLEYDSRDNVKIKPYSCPSENLDPVKDVKIGTRYYYKEVNGEPVIVKMETDGVCKGKQVILVSETYRYKNDTSSISKGFIRNGRDCSGGGGYIYAPEADFPANKQTTLANEGAEVIDNDPADRYESCGSKTTPNGFTLAEIEEEDAPEEPPIGHVYLVENGKKQPLEAVPRPYWAEPDGLAAIPVVDNLEFKPLTQEDFCGVGDPVVVQDSKWKKVLKFPGKMITGIAKAPLKILKGTANVFIPACEGSGRYENVLIQINPGDTSESLLKRIKDRIIESLKPECKIGRDASRVNEAFITINLDNVLDNTKTKIVETCGLATGKWTDCQTAENLIFAINECRDVCEDYGQGGFDVGGGAITVGLDCVGADFLNIIGLKADTAATAVFVGYGVAASKSSGGSSGGGATETTPGEKIISTFNWPAEGTPYSP